MWMRCSQCKGQFEIEPKSGQKLVFCSHCGAQLRVTTKRFKASQDPQSIQSISALTGETAEATEDESPFTVNALSSGQDPVLQALGGAPAEEISEQPPHENPADPLSAFTATPVPPDDSADPLAALTSPSASSSRAHAPRPVPFRRKKKQENMAPLVIALAGVGTLLLAGIIAAVVILNHKEEPKPVAPRSSGPDVGELFANVKATSSKSNEDDASPDR